MGREKLQSELEYLRFQRRRKTITNFRGLIMSQAEADKIKAEYCSGCGGSKGKYPKLWFGETFCSNCVERFQAGK